MLSQNVQGYGSLLPLSCKMYCVNSGPIAVKDDQMGDEISNYVFLLAGHLRGNAFLASEKDVKALIFASKEIGIEVNADKTMYNNMS
jgi:hypothetical protein